MKYLDTQGLTDIGNLVSDIVLLDSQVTVRLEAYSCKEGTHDKKLRKDLEHRHAEESLASAVAGAISPGSGSLGRSWTMSESPFAGLGDKEAVRMLSSLISTMNSSHPDYDFSTVNPAAFTKTLVPPVKLEIDNCLLEVYEAYDKANNIKNDATALGLKEKLWKEVDASIETHDCEVYSYTPDMDADPFTQVWSLNYFFYNKKLRRILFFQAYATSTAIDHGGDALNMSDDDENNRFEDSMDN